MRIFFSIPGEPVAKQRPRMNRFSGHTYTPEKTVNYENLVKMAFVSAYPNHEPFAKDVPLSVKVDAYFPIPSSTSKKKRAQMLNGEIRPTKKPDIDNCVKCLEDSGNGIIYVDDSSIVEIVARKWYSDTPRVEMTIKVVEPPLPFEEEI